MSEHVEIERSYDAPDGAAPPDLSAVDGVHRLSTRGTVHLDALYLDTADLALARSRSTLRRRTGGDDDGWHLKRATRADGTERTEVHAPLAEEPPTELLAAARVGTGSDAVYPLIRVENERTVTLLHGAGGVLAEVCHDRVRTTGLRPGMPSRQWVEWEVELVGGDEALLDRIEERLLAAGATRLPLTDKLARALSL